MTGLRRWLIRAALVAVMVIIAGVGVAAAQDGDNAEDAARVRCEAMTTIFQAFDMSPVAMRNYLREGGTIEELAAAHDVDLQGLEAEWRERLGDCVNRAREAGVITPEHAAVVQDALDRGLLAPFPPGDGLDKPDPMGVFSPGGWGVQSEDTVTPATVTQSGQRPKSPGSGHHAQGEHVNRPQREGVFMPGGWHWVDDPALGNVLDGDGVDWIGHPYYEGVFMPGGWHHTDSQHPTDLYDSPGDDTIRP